MNKINGRFDKLFNGQQHSPVLFDGPTYDCKFECPLGKQGFQEGYHEYMYYQDYVNKYYYNCYDYVNECYSWR